MLILPITWTQQKRIANLDRLRALHAERGGRIVEYLRIWSLPIVFARSTPVYEWVPEEGNRSLAGLKHALFCLLLGWWSWAGLFGTLGAILKDLSGGIDVTAVLTAPEGAPIAPHVLEELQRARRMHAVGFALVLFLILAALGWFLVYPSLKQYHVI